MIYKILIPSGIGDFSWVWSKFVTTKDKFYIEYIGGFPDRMSDFLKLLPKNRIVGYAPNKNYSTMWDEKNELICFPINKQIPPLPKMKSYKDLLEDKLIFVENNSYLEAGNRLENWLKEELPETEFHYDLKNKIRNPTRWNMFLVNFSSYGTKKTWGYYEVDVSVDIVEAIVKMTRWLPVFIGGNYDDYTEDIYHRLIDRKIKAVNLVGKTSLEDVVRLLQQTRMYFGACSGLMVMANILYTPVITYYPPFDRPPGRKLAYSWVDLEVPYQALFWEGKKKDLMIIEEFLKKI